MGIDCNAKHLKGATIVFIGFTQNGLVDATHSSNCLGYGIVSGPESADSISLFLKVVLKARHCKPLSTKWSVDAHKGLRDGITKNSTRRWLYELFERANQLELKAEEFSPFSDQILQPSLEAEENEEEGEEHTEEEESKEEAEEEQDEREEDAGDKKGKEQEEIGMDYFHVTDELGPKVTALLSGGFDSRQSFHEVRLMADTPDAMIKSAWAVIEREWTARGWKEFVQYFRSIWMQENPGWWLGFLGVFTSRGGGVEGNWPAVNRLIDGKVSVPRCIEIFIKFIIPHYARKFDQKLLSPPQSILSSED